MALALYDRVQETTTTAGTGSVTLLGAVDGFQTFAVVGDTNTCYYTIVDGSAWEVGVGTYSTTGPTLARTTVLSNSNADTSPITLSSSANTKTVFLTYPAEKSVNLNASGNVSPLGTVSSGTWQGSTVGVAYGGTGVTSSSGANSVVLRDGFGNITGFNNFVVGSSFTTTTGGTTVLTDASAQIQAFVGSSTQTVQLPQATTLSVGQYYSISNGSSGLLTVVDNASTTLTTVGQGGAAQVLCTNNSTSAGSWAIRVFASSNTTWSNAELSYNGKIINATWEGDTVQSGYGGTGLTSFTGANNALYSTSSSALTAGTLPVLAGGTGATTDSGARSNLGAAASGANSDITSLSGLTTPLSVGQGGTGLSSVTQYRIPYGNGTSALSTSVNFTYDGTYLLVGSLGGLGGATNPVIASVGTADNYVQSYVYNTENGESSSSDFVAYPSNGSDASGWIDIGVTSLTYDDAVYSITGPNEAYLFGSSPSTAGTAVTGNLIYATDSHGSANAHQWYVGGFNQLKSAWKMQLSSTELKVNQLIESTSGGFKFPDGTTQTSAASGSTYTRTSVAATAGQTTFSVTYSVGYIEVFLNGVLLNSADYTASNGSTVVLASAAALNDVVEFIAYSTQMAVLAAPVFPFFKANGVLDSIGILTGNFLPFYNSSGATKNIALTT